MYVVLSIRRQNIFCSRDIRVISGQTPCQFHLVGGVITIDGESALWMAFTTESIRFWAVYVVSEFAFTSFFHDVRWNLRFLAASEFGRLSMG